ncbi:MAG: hypothetical protein IJ695_10315 [Butyrivibrio sp.]|nr:hypothetical protein [Butyrivibrio sp.]
MKVRKYLGIAMALTLMSALSACGEPFPELSETEYDQTVEYAAGLLMKYSNNGQERLIYVDANEVEKQRKKEAQAAGDEPAPKPAPEPLPEPLPEPEPEPVPIYNEDGEPTGDSLTAEDFGQTESAPEIAEADTQEPAGSDTSQDAEGTGSSEASDPNAITLSSDESQEILDNIFLSYQGYMVSSTYPESSKSYVVNADKGKKLLVLRFDLYNAAGSETRVNMIPLNLLFEIVLNGKNLGYSSVTFLPNDLSSYTGTIDSKAHESVVVLTQIDSGSATNIESLGMIVHQGRNTQSVNLK